MKKDEKTGMCMFQSRSIAPVVVLGGKSALIYTLKVIERLMAPPGDELEKSQLLELLKKRTDSSSKRRARYC